MAAVGEAVGAALQRGCEPELMRVALTDGLPRPAVRRSE